MKPSDSEGFLFMRMKLNRIACQFVDSSDGRPIPLVITTTTDNVVVVSDNAGYVDIPVNVRLGTQFYLHVNSPGYNVPADGFGYRGFRLKVSNDIHKIRLKRINIAQRSGRITGLGKYIHGQSLGKISDVSEQPLTGMDSVQSASINGKHYVFYGDTNWTGYPLGNFKTTNGIATRQSILPNCPYTVDFSIESQGNAASSIDQQTTAQGVVWLSGVVTVDGEIHGYANHRKSLAIQLAHGHVRWNPVSKKFIDFRHLTDESWRHLDSHPIRFNEKNTDFLLFGHAIPNFRVPATKRALLSEDSYETFTCLMPNGDVDKDTTGNPIWRWRKDGRPLDAEREADLIKSGLLKRAQCRFLMTEVGSGQTVIPHRGSVRWNAFLKRWILIFTGINEPESLLGEVFMASGASPCGPWTACIKIASHPNYSFYNPVHHSWLDQKDGKTITLEGTYTQSFSGNTVATPHYEYNQLTYQVDMTDVRLGFLAG